MQIFANVRTCVFMCLFVHECVHVVFLCLNMYWFAAHVEQNSLNIFY